MCGGDLIPGGSGAGVGAGGAGGQYVFVVPEAELVVGFTSGYGGPPGGGQPRAVEPSSTRLHRHVRAQI